MQELLASCEVVFYDKIWENIGTRTSLKAYVSRATHLSSDHLSSPLEASVAAKMSWASKRRTSKPEDIAYSLLGPFEVNMPLLYGEGDRKAFKRLQYEIVRSRRDESIFAWTRLSHSQLDYATAPGPGLLAPSPKNFSESGNIVPIHPIHFERAKLHAPQILLDGLVWTLERSFIEDNDRKTRKILGRGEILYVAPLACSKRSDIYAPVKLQMVMSQHDPPRRGPSTSLESFSESEMQKLRNSKAQAQAQAYRLIQEQPRAHELSTKTFRRGFTLRLSTSAQCQCSTPSKYGAGVELHNNRESGEYIVLANEENQDIVGMVMRYKERAVIEVACDPVSFDQWRLVVKIHTKKFGIEFGGFNYSSGHNSINLGDRAIVSLEQGENISVLGWP